jgi:hypothetical protein
MHIAAYSGHAEAIKVLSQLGAQIDAQAANGETPLKLSIHFGQHQAAQVLRQLERAARTGKAAVTSERAQQAARQDTPEAREAAERNAAALLE